MDEQRENLQPEQNEAAAQDAKKTERGWESLAFLHDMVYLLAIVTILFTFFFRLVAVDGSSMYPTLVDKDYLVLESNFLYRDVKQGDIVVLKVDYFEKPIVKRVIATGGQTVDLQNGKVVVDGVVLDEPYTENKVSEPFEKTAVSISYPYTVPEGYLWVMGDSRTNSQDSRYFGAIDASSVTGHAVFTYWPIPHIGVLS